MNLKPYIDSGILELYAVNSLTNDERKGVERMLAMYPELKQELDAIELALESYAKATSIKPPDYLKERIVGSLFPLINSSSDYRNWLSFAKDLEERSLDKEGRYLKVLRQDSHVTQLLIISTTDIEEEIHEDEYESFLILEGECRCKIGDKLTHMSAGDYMEIPLHQTHDVELVSERVVAILQRINVNK